MMSTSECVCVCLSVREHISGTTCVIFTNFSVHVAYICGWYGDKIARGRGNFGGWPCHSKALAIFAAAFAATEIIQSPMTSCSRTGHSVCQGSANRNPENSEHRRCGLWAGKRVMGVHSAGRV